jgi:hypothetical protein
MNFLRWSVRPAVVTQGTTIRLHLPAPHGLFEWLLSQGALTVWQNDRLALHKSGYSRKTAAAAAIVPDPLTRLSKHPSAPSVSCSTAKAPFEMPSLAVRKRDSCSSTVLAQRFSYWFDVTALALSSHAALLARESGTWTTSLWRLEGCRGAPRNRESPMKEFIPSCKGVRQRTDKGLRMAMGRNAVLRNCFGGRVEGWRLSLPSYMREDSHHDAVASSGEILFPVRPSGRPWRFSRQPCLGGTFRSAAATSFVRSPERKLRMG